MTSQKRPLLVQASVAEMLSLQHWFTSAEQQQSWGGDSFSYPCTADVFLSQLCRPATTSFSLICQHSSELLAFGQLCDRFGFHHLARIAVAPLHRGTGLSRVLLAELMLKAFAETPRSFSLYVHRHNVTAVALYTSFGFEMSATPEAENERLYFMTLSEVRARQITAAYLRDINRSADAHSHL